MRRLPLPAPLLILAGMALAAPSTLPGIEPRVSKLLTRDAPDPESLRFGAAVAVSDRWVALGEPGNDSRALDSGAVHVRDARTGRHLRRLDAGIQASPGQSLGEAVGVAGNFLVAGAPGDAAGGAEAGALFVFDLRNGALRHKLTAGDAAAGDRLGASAAISGDLVLGGAPGKDGEKGAAYVFDLSTGQQVAKLEADDGAGLDRFGGSVALQGELALVGASGNNSSRGAAYLFDALKQPPGTGQLFKLTASDAEDGDGLGAAVALAGRRAVAGASGKNTARGAAYVFDIRAGGELGKLEALDGAAGAAFGASVAVSGHLALAGAPGAAVFGPGSGAAYLFDLARLQQVRKLVPSDGNQGWSFGSSVALEKTAGAAGSPGDDSLAPESGSAYLLQPLAGPLPLESLAKRRDFAPGAGETVFSAFGNAYLSPQGRFAFDSRLGGPGSGGGRDTGAWTTQGTGSLRLMAKSRVDFGEATPALPALAGVRAGTLSLPMSNQNGSVLFQATLAGTGVSAADNRAILKGTGASLGKVLRTGEDIGALGNARFRSFTQLVQPIQNNSDNASLAYTLARGTGLPLADASNDSGVLSVSGAGAIAGVAAREGQNAPAGAGPASVDFPAGRHGQFFGRVARPFAFHAFPSFRTLDGDTPRQALYLRNPGGAEAGRTAIQGQEAFGVQPIPFRAFLGETLTSTNAVLYRATLGAGAGAGTNEGLWSGGNLRARKGDQAPGEAAGVVWDRFLGFWPMDASRFIFLARLRGPGIRANNDLGVWLRQENGSFLELLREGRAAPDCDGARIGVIQRMDVEAFSGNYRYVIQASLTGAAAANQALYIGAAGLGDAVNKPGLRKPALVLRKGTLYQGATGESTRLRSLRLSPVTDATGAGGKGLGQVINQAGTLILEAQFNNNAREILVGTP